MLRIRLQSFTEKALKVNMLEARTVTNITKQELPTFFGNTPCFALQVSDGSDLSQKSGERSLKMRDLTLKDFIK